MLGLVAGVTSYVLQETSFSLDSWDSKDRKLLTKNNDTRSRKI